MPFNRSMCSVARFSRQVRNRHILLFDILAIALSALLSFDMRLETLVPLRLLDVLALYIALSLGVRMAAFAVTGIYRRYWQYATPEDFIELAGAVSVSSLVLGLLVLGVLLPFDWVSGFPRSVLVIDWVVCLVLTGAGRFLLRYLDRAASTARRTSSKAVAPVIVVGAGAAGAVIAREIAENPRLGMQVIGFVDDDRDKQHVRVHGLPVLGTCEDLNWLVLKHRVAKVLIAMPSAPGAAIRSIREQVTRVGVEVLTLPGIGDIISGQAGVSIIREVQIEDLLRREPVKTDTDSIRASLRGKRVLVTGAGGSIGSELCRQVALAEPGLLVLAGHGENSIFAIQQELQRRFPAVPLQAVIVDIRDRSRLDSLFRRWRPQAVFHAAAHKHVPLMEDNPVEAVTNNIVGTRNVVETAEAHDVERLVMISTDKAVEPSSVMGCSKRLAEGIVLAAARRTGRPYAAVRFGNVLNSRGSVIPVFKEQIRAGGPVTVTHAEMTRYFMTIPEAVQLVLQAGILAVGGETFVLDMGEPVKIVDLATDLIELSGLKPYEDIDIVFTGVRPGEKLHEILFYPDESLGKTAHGKIMVARNGCGPDTLVPDGVIDRLEQLARDGSETEVRALLREVMAACRAEPAPAKKGEKATPRILLTESRAQVLETQHQSASGAPASSR